MDVTGGAVTSKTNWEAIGAVAGIASVLIALAAWHSPSPQPSPQPTVTYPYTSPAAPPDQGISAQATAPTAGQPATVPPPSAVAPGRPPGCDEAFTVINAFGRTWAASATVQARQNAASTAEQGLMSASLSASEPVYSQDVTLERDFLVIANDLADGESGADAVTRTNADIATLNSDCAVR